MTFEAAPGVDGSNLRDSMIAAVGDVAETATIWIAFSGGLDSTALLYTARQCFPPAQLKAIHINHGVSSDADAWQAHCKRICVDWGIEFIGQKLSWNAPISNFEAEARAQRYDIFENLLKPNDVILMGHHLDDQIETFFLRLMRGAGVDGLSGMPASRPLGQGRLVRPFLDRVRVELASVVESAGIAFVEDASNQDNQYDRNFMRNRVLPLLASRWPMYRKPMARTLSILDGMRQDNVAEQSELLKHRLTEDGGLKTPGLMELPQAERVSLLREWLRTLASVAPSMTQLQHVIDDVIAAQPDAQPIFQLGTGHIRRFKTAIYFTPALPELLGITYCLDAVGAIEMPGSGHLDVKLGTVTDQRRPLIRQDLMPLVVRFGESGVMAKPVGRSGTRDLKRLLQEYRVKPWLRSRMPLIFHGDNLVAVGDLFVVEGYQAAMGEQGHQISWKPIA